MTQFPEGISFSGRIFGCLPAKVGQAIESDRAKLRALGWRRTKLTNFTQQPSLLSGLVDAEWTLTGFDRRPWPKASAVLGSPSVYEKLTRGTRVRTLGEGENWAGGTKHTMPSGSIGYVVSTAAWFARVRFEELPGRTFTYAFDQLRPM